MEGDGRAAKFGMVGGIEMGACRWSIMNVRTWGVSSSFTPILCYEKFSSATSHSHFRGRSSATKTCRVQLETRIAWGSHQLTAMRRVQVCFCESRAFAVFIFQASLCFIFIYHAAAFPYQIYWKAGRVPAIYSLGRFFVRQLFQIQPQTCGNTGLASYWNLKNLDDVVWNKKIES